MAGWLEVENETGGGMSALCIICYALSYLWYQNAKKIIWDKGVIYGLGYNLNANLNISNTMSMSLSSVGFFVEKMRVVSCDCGDGRWKGNLRALPLLFIFCGELYLDWDCRAEM